METKERNDKEGVWLLFAIVFPMMFLAVMLVTWFESTDLYKGQQQYVYKEPTVFVGYKLKIIDKDHYRYSEGSGRVSRIVRGVIYHLEGNIKYDIKDDVDYGSIGGYVYVKYKNGSPEKMITDEEYRKFKH